MQQRDRLKKPGLILSLYCRQFTEDGRIFTIQELVSDWGLTIQTSLADPDLDPVRSGLFGSPGSGSGSRKIPDPDLDPLSTKRPL